MYFMIYICLCLGAMYALPSGVCIHLGHCVGTHMVHGALGYRHGFWLSGISGISAC